MVSDAEFEVLLARCAELPPAPNCYLIDDFVDNLLLTVLDYQLQTTTVERAMAYFKRERRQDIRTAENLRITLSRFPADQTGNTGLAQYLWGYSYWNRAAQLRELLAFFESIGVTSQEALRTWASTSTFEKCFMGRVHGLGFAVYQWLIMRQGIETVKPDIHVTRFVESAIHRVPGQTELVASLERVASHLGLKAYQLDWRIWEDGRRKKGH